MQIKPGDDLLSHGEAPHYHWRNLVSLPSSRWDRVVPRRCGRRENWWSVLFAVVGWATQGDCPSGKQRQRIGENEVVALARVHNNRCHIAYNVKRHCRFTNVLVAHSVSQLLGCYMVKPHGQLVQVSFTHYCASTPCLSTLWSSRALQESQGFSENSSWEGLPA